MRSFSSKIPQTPCLVTVRIPHPRIDTLIFTVPPTMISYRCSPLRIALQLKYSRPPVIHQSTLSIASATSSKGASCFSSAFSSPLSSSFSALLDEVDVAIATLEAGEPLPPVAGPSRSSTNLVSPTPVSDTDAPAFEDSEDDFDQVGDGSDGM